MVYVSKAGFFVVGFASLSLVLAACSGSTIHKRSSLGDIQTLSLDAKQRLVITGHNEYGKSIVCAEPSPDALVAQAAVLSASGRYAGPQGSPSAGGNVGVGLQESAASIGYRTQSIQILRDGYYRLCESYLNGAIKEDEYRKVVSNLDTFIVVALAVDGLGNSKSATNVGLSAGKVDFNFGAGSGDPEKPAESGGGGAIEPAKIVPIAPDATVKDTKETAEAVANIVHDYLEYKGNYLQFCAKRGVDCRKL
ncbi:MAG: hypothetical protein Q8L53_06740 [Aestuariivirga sp.]|nr:hypothetical protein [Aestuariivirga sp.]